MTAAASPSRASRSRIVIVGDAGPLDDVDRAARRIDSVANMYEAIGEIASSTAAEPIETVLIAESAVQHPLEAIAESIHRLDPGVLVYLVVRSDVDGTIRRRALAARFDGILQSPVTSRMLEQDLDDAALGLLPPAATPRGTPLVLVESQDEGDSPVDHDIAAAMELDREFETARDEARAAQRVEKARTQPQGPAGSLGDIDIVEAMLDNPAEGIRRAIALIEQETGWTGVRLIDRADSEVEGVREYTTEVVFRGASQGFLLAPGRAQHEIEPWAAWLARWAALASAQRALADIAHTDSLTGAWNRRYFDHLLPRILEEAKEKRRQIPIMVFDVDNLKTFNDRHGHEAGDTVLRETVRLLRSIIRRGDHVFRIGGDEFVAVFADPDPPRVPGSGVIESVETIARRFHSEICSLKFPKLGPEAPGTLSISAGLATYPWDGTDAESLVRLADQLAIDSKRGGKNALTIGPGAAANCAPPLSEQS